MEGAPRRAAEDEQVAGLELDIGPGTPTPSRGPEPEDAGVPDTERDHRRRTPFVSIHMHAHPSTWAVPIDEGHIGSIQLASPRGFLRTLFHHARVDGASVCDRTATEVAQPLGKRSHGPAIAVVHGA
jgi:hypothetical protein